MAEQQSTAEGRLVSHEPASRDTQANLCVTGETQHQSTSKPETTALVGRLRLSARGSVVLHHDHYRKDCADAADEIERLCRIPAHYGAPVDDPDAAIQWITGLMDTEARHLREEVKRLREALRRIVQECGRARGDQGHRDASRFAFATAYKAVGEGVADG